MHAEALGKTGTTVRRLKQIPHPDPCWVIWNKDKTQINLFWTQALGTCLLVFSDEGLARIYAVGNIKEQDCVFEEFVWDVLVDKFGGVPLINEFSEAVDKSDDDKDEVLTHVVIDSFGESPHTVYCIAPLEKDI
ncbi:hypothetical protein ACFL3E_02475 [Patescibacteria group bacterium]